jgi:hypothetical protein
MFIKNFSYPASTQTDLDFFDIFTFHIWNMESIGFACKKKKKIANFHVLGLFMPKKQVQSENKNSVCHAALPSGRWSKFVSTISQPSLGLQIFIWDLATLRQMGWIDAPHTQNFEILKSLKQTQESKNFKIAFEIFEKMLDGWNFD